MPKSVKVVDRLLKSTFVNVQNEIKNPDTFNQTTEGFNGRGIRKLIENLRTLEP